MGTLPESSISHSPTAKDLSPAAQAAAGWFRQLARALKTARLYRTENPIVQQVRAQVAESLNEHLKNFGTWKLTFTSSEIHLEDEVIVRPTPRAAGSDSSSVLYPEETLPFTFYRDGIRGMTLRQGVPRTEIDALFEALRAVGASAISHDDLVTLLWQANLTYIQLESVPLEQTIYLSSKKGRKATGPGTRGLAYAWTPSGSEIRADIGQVAGSQGLHRDTFDDWPLPEVHAQTGNAYRTLLPVMEVLRAATLAAWEEERNRDWTEEAPVVLRQILEFDPTEDTRQSLAHSVVSWLIAGIQHSAWGEAMRALSLLREFDPDLSRAGPEIEKAMKELPNEEIAAQLDEADPDVHARFAALLVALGPVAVDLAFTVLEASTRVRPRAAASTALCYICGDNPRLLMLHLEDPRWFVVRNVVFVLGQIGGSGVVDLLRLAAMHPEPRVKRAVVQALGNVSRAERTPVLMNLLHTRDAQLFAATLGMLTREKNPRITKALLDRISAPEFEELTEDNQRALFNALADVADEELIEPLEELLKRGAWFSRPSLVRIGAARTLRRIGTEKALAILETGLRSKSEAVRVACLDAMSSRSTL